MGTLKLEECRDDFGRVQIPSKPQDEERRLDTLCSLDVLDTSAEERFDRITRLARRLFGVPIALVSLVDRERQWFKSRQGLDATETPREISFCGHAILGMEVLEVSDARIDERFADNPLVTGAPRIRFYAGCPLLAPDGQAMGTLCIIDREPRKLGEQDQRALRDLAGMVEAELAALDMATTDTLTKISNRRGFEVLAGQALRLAARSRWPAALLYFDLDAFKPINDIHGHEAGDQALREFAALLVDVFRDSDVIARLGGDEFCVLLSNVAESEVHAPLERLAARIEARNESPETLFDIEYSVGIVSEPMQGPASLEDLLVRADRAMFEQKQKRRTER